MSVPMPISRATLCNAIAVSSQARFAHGKRTAAHRRPSLVACKPGEGERLFVAHGVDAPRPGTGGGKIKEGEAIERRELTAVDDREEAAAEMGVEIHHRRHA